MQGWKVEVNGKRALGSVLVLPALQLELSSARTEATGGGRLAKGHDAQPPASLACRGTGR